MSSPSDGILVIKNGTLIDGTDGSPRPNGRIVIRSGKIAEVGPEAPFDQVNGARVIDAAGRFILPGLIHDNGSIRDVGERATVENCETRTLTAV